MKSKSKSYSFTIDNFMNGRNRRVILTTEADSQVKAEKQITRLFGNWTLLRMVRDLDHEDLLLKK